MPKPKHKPTPEEKRLKTHLSTLLSAARLVVARWDNGDLADAVRNLEEEADDVVEAFPELVKRPTRRA